MPAGAGGRRDGERAEGRDTKRQGGGLIAVELQQATAGELDFALGTNSRCLHAAGMLRPPINELVEVVESKSPATLSGGS